MKHTPSSPAKSDSIFASLVALIGLAHIGILYQRPDSTLVNCIPDDGFYYLQTARNFARIGRWTFDGVEHASGFHILWGYLLALFFKLFPNAGLHTVFAVFGTFQVFCIALAAYLIAITARRLFGSGAIPGIAIVILSAVVLQQAGWLMESALVILASATAVYIVASLRPFTVRTGIVAVAVGFFMMVSRSDTGLFALILFLACLLFWLRKQLPGTRPLISGLILVGSVLGLCVTLLHTHLVSGHWVQSSALEKIYWTRLEGHTIALKRAIFISITFGHPFFNSIIPLQHSAFPHLLYEAGSVFRYGILAALIWGAVITFRSTADNVARTVLLSQTSVIFGYYVLYLQDAAMGWYVAIFIVPFALLAAAASCYFSRISALCRSVLYGVALFTSLCGFFYSLSASMPWQVAMYDMGVYLHARPQLRGVGSFNSGIIGFFADDGVINLDGLVNDSILPYSQQGTLTEYMTKRHITMIADMPFMFDSTLFQRRGGYSNGQLVHCITSVDNLLPNSPNDNNQDSQIHLYHLDPVCLTATPPHP